MNRRGRAHHTRTNTKSDNQPTARVGKSGGNSSPKHPQKHPEPRVKVLEATGITSLRKRPHRTIVECNEGDKWPVNISFAQDFQDQFKSLSIKCAEQVLLKRINEEIACVNRRMEGTSGQSNQTPLTVTVDAITDKQIELLPCSKWVFETPDKQRIKKMEELNFNQWTPLEPAVMGQDDKSKMVFALHKNVAGKFDLAKVQTGQEVPIDLNYLKPVCTMNKENDQVLFHEENQFLTQRVEKSININQIDLKENAGASRKRPHDTDNLTWYEKHMKLLATCRPAKPVEKVDRRTLLHRKSLSFEGDTPTSHKRVRSQFRSLDNILPEENECEKEESTALESEFYDSPSEDSPKAVSNASPQLSYLLGSLATTSFYEVPTSKFYRKNYD